MRKIAVVTSSRSEYGTSLPILRRIQNDHELTLQLIVSGTHLSAEYGHTVDEIKADGFEINDTVQMLLSSDSPEAIAKSMGLATIGFAQSFAKSQPDILLLVGDRYELLSIASAALPFRIPLAHVSGGDISEGAIDNQVRHAISKMSHLHFVAMQQHADRLIQMGEEGWRIRITGEPALDLIPEFEPLERGQLSSQLGIELESPIVVITFHPTTLGKNNGLDEIDNLLNALNRLSGTLIFSSPNADAGRQLIAKRIREFVDGRPSASFFHNLGQAKYYRLLSLADVMVGNSSSGIWEAPGFELPVVNIGERQQGRIRARNVIDVVPDADQIYFGIQRALQPSFRRSLKGLENPYGDGNASSRIVEALKKIELGQTLLQKRFETSYVARTARSDC